MQSSVSAYDRPVPRIDKTIILDEIRRLADENDGIPPGREVFRSQTGISHHSWAGVYWATWGEAVREAGYAPNVLRTKTVDDNGLLELLAEMTRNLARFPTQAELKMAHTADASFPAQNTFAARLGNRPSQVAKLRAFAERTSDYADILGLLLGDEPTDVVVTTKSLESAVRGVIYLVRSGRYYKIGRSNDIGRRTYELRLQLPERAELVHAIETDDPVGIERYWHERFDGSRTNGEWFLLTAADIAAFKLRRRFM